MKARGLLRGLRRLQESGKAGFLFRSEDSSSHAFHFPIESRSKTSCSHGGFLLPELKSAPSSGSRPWQSDLGFVAVGLGRSGIRGLGAGAAGSRTIVLPGTQRWIVSRSLGEGTQSFTRWPTGGGRGLIPKSSAMHGVQRYLRRTIYGGGSGEQAVWALIGANAFVFCLWQMGATGFMVRHFQVSYDSLMRGRIHTLVTSAFSQSSFQHLFTNMIGLYFFGTEIAYLFGPKYLVGLYLAGGIAGSIGHVLYWAYYVPWAKGIPRAFYNPSYAPGAMGASGAVNAIIIFNVLLNPTRTIYVNFFIPVPAALLGILLIGSDLFSAANESSETSHAGHLGGALVGAIAYLLT